MQTGDIIYNSIVAILVAAAVFIIIYLARRGEKERMQGKQNVAEDNEGWRALLLIGGFLFFPLHIIRAAIPKTKEGICRQCGYRGPLQKFCPSCNKNNQGQVRQYKCNYCFSIFNTYSEYCPTCGKDNSGKFINGAS